MEEGTNSNHLKHEAFYSILHTSFEFYCVCLSLFSLTTLFIHTPSYSNILLFGFYKNATFVGTVNKRMGYKSAVKAKFDQNIGHGGRRCRAGFVCC